MSEEEERDYETMKTKIELRLDQTHLKQVHQVEFKHYNQNPS